MTGFGKAVSECADKNIVVEIKSLNSKQLDLGVRVPYTYKEKELLMRSMVSEKLSRGKIEVSVYFENKEGAVAKTINTSVAKAYFKQFVETIKEIGIDGSVDSSVVFDTVMRQPDIFSAEHVELDENEWAVMKQTVESALEQIDNYRADEGAALEKDLRKRIEKILTNLKSIEPLEKQRIETVKARIQANLNSALTDCNYDENRFEQELIFFLERMDITEEKVRLRQHCKYFIETIEAGNVLGKKLNFIAQEIGREINTIGSKANDAGIQQHVVLMKDDLEKIKEQVLNIL